MNIVHYVFVDFSLDLQTYRRSDLFQHDFSCNVSGHSAHHSSFAVPLLVVAPTQNVLSSNPVQAVVAGERQSLACQTDSLNPTHAWTVQWLENDTALSDSTVVTLTGEHGGPGMISTYSFVAAPEQNGTTFSCSIVHYVGAFDVDHLQRSKTIDVHCE